MGKLCTRAQHMSYSYNVYRILYVRHLFLSSLVFFQTCVSSLTDHALPL